MLQRNEFDLKSSFMGVKIFKVLYFFEYYMRKSYDPGSIFHSYVNVQVINDCGPEALL